MVWTYYYGRYTRGAAMYCRIEGGIGRGETKLTPLLIALYECSPYVSQQSVCVCKLAQPFHIFEQRDKEITLINSRATVLRSLFFLSRQPLPPKKISSLGCCWCADFFLVERKKKKRRKLQISHISEKASQWRWEEDIYFFPGSFCLRDGRSVELISAG